MRGGHGMRKSFGIYSVIWVICLAVFNVITFMTPNEIGGVSKYGSFFWIGYAFISAAFVGELICSFFALKAENLRKLFYNLSLIATAYIGLVMMLIVGGTFMALPMLPAWIGIIVCTFILGCNIIAVIKASVAIEIVESMDEKMKMKTYFIRNLTAEAKSLMDSARDDAFKCETKKIYETFRYSNPVSGNGLADINLQIERTYRAFAEAVNTEDIELCQATSRTLIELLKKRNDVSK